MGKSIPMEGLDLRSESNLEANVKITLDDVKEEIEYWHSAIVCFVLGSNPSLIVIEGFFKVDLGLHGIR